jgi:hypothetical protein
MRRTGRIVTLLGALLAALAVAGCGNKEKIATVADTEGIYVGVDGLTYQVQISRILNPADPEDSAYLKGIPDTVPELTKDECWFGVFMRVENENDSDQPLTPTDGFKITDTQGAVFEPVELNADLNPFAYAPVPLPGGNTVLPILGSPPSDNTIQGSLILFKVTVASLYNRPLELEIESQRGGKNAVVDLDI